jgi:hypothetical protein
MGVCVDVTDARRDAARIRRWCAAWLWPGDGPKSPVNLKRRADCRGAQVRDRIDFSEASLCPITNMVRAHSPEAFGPTAKHEHTHAYELMMEGVPVPIIQQQLGHTSLATTDRYVSHLAPVDLIAHMQHRDWSL